jgi:hypothetical protein
MEKVTLKVKSASEFTNFLKRFSPIESTLLLEIENGYLKAKTHTPERSVVKSSKIDMSQIFDMEGVLTTGQNILFGIFSVDKLTEAFKHFSETDVEFTLSYENTSDGMVGTEVTLSSPSLTINFQCASLRLFTHITDEMMDRISNTEAAPINFVLTKEHQKRISSISTIDSDHKLLTVNVKEGNVNVTGRSYDLSLMSIDDKATDDVSISIYKNQFGFLDREDAVAHLSGDRIVFSSIETETKTIIGKAE